MEEILMIEIYIDNFKDRNYLSENHASLPQNIFSKKKINQIVIPGIFQKMAQFFEKNLSISRMMQIFHMRIK